MLFLHSKHITDLYCLVDDVLHDIEKPMRVGRPPLLSPSELVTALIWNSLTVRSKTLRGIHVWLCLYHQAEFPKIPGYSAFVAECHAALPLLLAVLQALLVDTAAVRILDSTMLPVCKHHRANSHRVAKGIARFGKNHQGWHYGFKLHASVDMDGRLAGIFFTPANESDSQMMPRILNRHTRLAVGDTSYGAKVMGRRIWEEYGTVVIAPPHPSQKRKLMATWQHLLLEYRSKIESAFDLLKEHLHFVSSFPRSVAGYLLHYVRVLSGYQVQAL